MRRASTGPTPGNASSCSAVALSTSIFVAGNARFAFPLGARWRSVESRAGKLSGGNRWRPRGCLIFPFPFFAPRAESTASSCASSARVLAGGTFSIVPTARSARTDAPSRATLARKRRALFSEGVGMAPDYNHAWNPPGSNHFATDQRAIESRAPLPRPRQSEDCAPTPCRRYPPSCGADCWGPARTRRCHRSSSRRR